MPQIINTNISSLNSQRHLNTTQSALSRSLERLSSGKRINNAKDDAAGLGISSRMTTQVNGMNQAIRNARDGISLGQTAEGALSTSADMLQRIRVLAVQSSNATNASLDRQAIQDEVGQLAAELNRIAMTTSFNGQRLLDGTMGAQNFQVGANAGEIITANGMNFKTEVYGTHRVQADAAESKAAAADSVFAGSTSGFLTPKITINGPLGNATVTPTPAAAGVRGTTAQEMAGLINVVSDKTGVTATARTEVLFKAAATAGSYSYLLASENADDAAVTISFTIAAGATSSDDYAQAINAFNAQSSKTGVTAEYDATNNGIKLVNANGNDINMASQSDTAPVATLATYKGDGSLNTAVNLAAATAGGDMVTVFTKGVVTFDSSASYSLSKEAAAADDAFGIANASAMTVATGSSDLKTVASLDVTTFAKAQLAIAIADAAINTINKEMARYGALQSRFEATIANLEVNSENTANARSRIMDADFAQETAELSRATILQQAGIAMLAQANQMPQNVLSLIR
jgi:flagellin